jgi:glyoxylase-like metal-dependent hydrolase (beta-lactamase superfamily II)
LGGLAIKAIQVGQARIQTVEEYRFFLDVRALTSDESFIKANEDWLRPLFYDPVSQQLSLICQSFLVKFGDMTVLIDPCTGNGKSRPAYAPFNNLNTPYLKRFEETGTRPEDVDIVICTHLHCDHCGWNTKLQDGRWVPTFPNARYIFVRGEVDRWDPKRPGYKPADFNVGAFEDSVQPILEAGLAELVETNYAISEHLTLEPAPGHTEFHAVIRLRSEGLEAYFTGDAFHHPLQIAQPELHLGDENLGDGAATRRRLLDALATSGALMLPAHFIVGGHIRRDAQSYRFQPLFNLQEMPAMK